MALPAFSADGNQVKTGPGRLLMAPVGTALPTVASTAGKFTHSFDAAWKLLGYTDEGMEVSFGKDVDPVEVAESYYRLRTVTTMMSATVGVSLASINKSNLQFALSGGTWAVSGSAGTTVSKFSPPKPGSEVRHMLAWIGQDDDEMYVFYQVFQAGEVTQARRKGADKASLAGLSFEAEVPSSTVSTDVWNYWAAGEWIVDPSA